MNDNAPPQVSPDYSQYSPKWQFRFNFYDRHGAPSSKNFKPAFKTLSSGEKLKININWWAFFFGFIYFFVVGMWRKGLVLLAIILAVSVTTALLLPESIDEIITRPIAIAFAVLAGMTANYSYYLHRIKGSTSWNLFEGLRMA